MVREEITGSRAFSAHGSGGREKGAAAAFMLGLSPWESNSLLDAMAARAAVSMLRHRIQWFSDGTFRCTDRFWLPAALKSVSSVHRLAARRHPLSINPIRHALGPSCEAP